MDETPCRHEHDLDQCGPGYRAPTSRWWTVVEDVAAWRAGKDWRRTEHVDVRAGTRLRLDQTDFTVGTGNDGSDAWIDQRFLVLDGPLAGECVAFVADRPGLDVSWVPDAIAPDGTGKQCQAPTTQMTGPPQAVRMNVPDTCLLRSSNGPSES